MPRVTVAGFVDPSNELRARNADMERTINRYLEATAPGDTKVSNYLAPAPGLRVFAQIGDSPGNTSFYQDGRFFGVTGTTYWEAFSDGTTATRGTVTAASSSLPAQIVSNGTAGDQNLVMSGGNGYVHTLSTNAFTIIDNTTFPGTGFPYGNCAGIEFINGWGIALQGSSRKWFLSALEDFTSWDPLDVAERSEGSDNLVGVIRNYLSVFFPGTKTSEIWYPNGDALFPFAPVPGVFIETGAISPIMARVNNTVAWLGIDERGFGVVYVLDGYSPKRISTHAVETAIQQSSQLGAARLFAQQQEGHAFLWLRIPDLQTSWVFDFVYGQWHERAIWNPDTCLFEPHLASNAAFAFNTTLVTDATSGVIYDLSLFAYDDALAT
jgi:hypothetical protein